MADQAAAAALVAQQAEALQEAQKSLTHRLAGAERATADRQAELDALNDTAWLRLGRRLRLVRTTRRHWSPAVEVRAAKLFMRWQLWRLRVDRLRNRVLRPGRQRVLATACWHFPIYSQTFVYQELTQLMRSGRVVRFLYGERNWRDPLPAQFRSLWRSRRRFVVHPEVCRESYDHFMRVAPERVESLLELLTSASGLSRKELTGQHHFGQAFAFARLVEAYRPDYVHSYFFYEGTLFALVASHLLGIPRGVSCYADHMLQDYVLKVVPLHLRQCSVIVATSERIKRELLAIEPGCDASRILVKPNGINVTSFPTVSRPGFDGSRPLQLVSVSRIEPKKGLLYLVDAVGRLRDQSVPVVLRLIGGSDDNDVSRDYSRALRDRISTLRLQECVHVEGRKSESEINDIFKGSHLFVAPYVETDAGDKDGVPTAMLEAMSSGLPVVATDAGSIREVIRHEHDGLIVPQKDPVALADAITKLFREPHQLTQLGANAGTRVRETFEASKCERHLHERLDQLRV